MNLHKYKVAAVMLILAMAACLPAGAQQQRLADTLLTPQQKGMIRIASRAGTGDLSNLKNELQAGLDSGLTVSQAKEVLVHIYAYCGFPRSLRGLQTLMTVLDERKARGIKDEYGTGASPVKREKTKYETGKETLARLTNAPQDAPATGYAAFAPVIDTFLKEHLFADIFERDVLSYADRELVTISVLSSIGGVEPMLRSHLSICLNVGITAGQLKQFVNVIQTAIGETEVRALRTIVKELVIRKDVL